MALYLCVSRLQDGITFTRLLRAHNSFRGLQPEWHLLFNEKDIFEKCRIKTSSERCQFNLLVMKHAIRADYGFIVEDLLDGRTLVTDKMIQALLELRQYKLLVQLISIPLAR